MLEVNSAHGELSLTVLLHASKPDELKSAFKYITDVAARLPAVEDCCRCKERLLGIFNLFIPKSHHSTKDFVLHLPPSPYIL